MLATKPEAAKTFINVTLDLAYDVTNVTVLFSFSIPKDKNDKNFERVILKSSVNLCKLFKGNVGNFLGKTLTELFDKFADFEPKCPIRKVNHIIL